MTATATRQYVILQQKIADDLKFKSPPASVLMRSTNYRQQIWRRRLSINADITNTETEYQ